MNRGEIWLLGLVGLVIVLRLVAFKPTQFAPGTKVKITATLHEEPKISGQRQIFSLAGLRVFTPRYPDYHYGDRLEVVGLVELENKLTVSEIEVTASEKSFRVWLNNLRRQITSRFREFLPEPQAGLLAGVVLGSKDGLSSDFYQDLKKTGTVHMVVASGMNVTIVAGTLLGFLLLFLSRRRALILAVLGIWFYVFLSGGEIPVLRAGLMATFVFLAQGLGREGDSWRALIWAGLILLLLDPSSLFDLGFQLSFLATFGLLFFGPKLDTWLARIPKVARTDLSQTLGAQAATFPVIWWHFGQYSPFSPLVNVLVTFTLPLMMKLGGLVAIVALIFPFLGQVFAWSLWPILTYFVKVVEFFSNL